MKIAQLYRTFYDEDGTHQWWCNWNDEHDRLTGRQLDCVDGVRIEVEHDILRERFRWFRKNERYYEGTERRYYTQDQIRWWK